jgi:gluconokinase
MGVSGSGKTTVARGLADALDLSFAEADDFHPPENVEKMRHGIPLTDADREPWLRELASWMAARAEEGRSTVMACSALRRTYRDVLRTGPPSVDFIHLDGPPAIIRERMIRRKGHFMPASLLDSQEAVLEPLEEDESGVVLDLSRPPDDLVAEAVAWIRAH